MGGSRETRLGKSCVAWSEHFLQEAASISNPSLCPNPTSAAAGHGAESCWWSPGLNPISCACGQPGLPCASSQPLFQHGAPSQRHPPRLSQCWLGLLGSTWRIWGCWVPVVRCDSFPCSVVRHGSASSLWGPHVTPKRPIYKCSSAATEMVLLLSRGIHCVSDCHRAVLTSRGADRGTGGDDARGRNALL